MLAGHLPFFFFFLSYHHHGGEAFSYPAGFASPAKRAMVVLFPCELGLVVPADEQGPQ
jgi:hypothetical protein